MIEYVVEKSGTLAVSKIVFPLVVVITQDCDLQQDHLFHWSRTPKTTQDKWLLSALVAPLYNVEQVYQGVHLSDLGMKMEPINSKKSPGQYLRNNERPRFHFVSFPKFLPIANSVIDFKHYFSVNIKYLRKLRRTNFVCQLSPLYREDVLQRFSAYLSRIGLPTDNVTA
jgi:hypothetical protein